jgi:hypothetical protein
LPAITAISPNSGNTGGGTSVSISGSGFSQSVTVTFGGLPAIISFSNETSISLRTPPMPRAA